MEKNKQEIITYIRKNEMAIRKLYNSKYNYKCCKITKTKVMSGLEYVLKKLTDENCPICMCPWFDNDEPLNDLFGKVVIGLECNHFYHGECLDNCLKESYL